MKPFYENQTNEHLKLVPLKK